VHPQCWTLVPWRDTDGHVNVAVEAVQTTRQAIIDAHDVTAQRIHAPERNERNIATWRNSERRADKHEKRWVWGRPSTVWSDNPYVLAWATPGADRDRAKPYMHPPWDPNDPWQTPRYEWNDVFPPGFAAKFQALIQHPRTKPCDLHTCEYYDLTWTCIHNCIVRDIGLWKRPLVREYYHEVVVKFNWWWHGGSNRRAYSADTSFETIGPRSAYKEIVVFTPAPGRSVRGSRTSYNRDTVRQWRQQEIQRPADLSDQSDDERKGQTLGSSSRAPPDARKRTQSSQAAQRLTYHDARNTLTDEEREAALLKQNTVSGRKWLEAAGTPAPTLDPSEVAGTPASASADESVAATAFVDLNESDDEPFEEDVQPRTDEEDSPPPAPTKGEGKIGREDYDAQVHEERRQSHPLRLRSASPISRARRNEPYSRSERPVGTGERPDRTVRRDEWGSPPASRPPLQRRRDQSRGPPQVQRAPRQDYSQQLQQQSQQGAPQDYPQQRQHSQRAPHDYQQTRQHSQQQQQHHQPQRQRDMAYVRQHSRGSRQHSVGGPEVNEELRPQFHAEDQQVKGKGAGKGKEGEIPHDEANKS
jgi:hypothetical protein